MPSAISSSKFCGADDGCRPEAQACVHRPSRGSGHDGNRAQRSHRRHRGDEDQPDAHRLQHDHLRSPRLHRRAVRCAGQYGLDRPRAADVHPRHERHGEDQAQSLRPGKSRSRRHPADQRRLHHRQPSQPHDLHGADLPRRRGGGVLVLHGALARCRRHPRRRHDRYLLRRPADADREDLSQGRAERGAHLRHQDQCAPAGTRHGRLPRPDRRGANR